MNEQSTSPIINKANNKSSTMSFFDAIREVMINKKIHKLEWENKEYFSYLKNGILTLHKPDGKDYQWIISDGDMSGTDWIVL